MPIPISIVDAFTGVPFRGNPAAVCVLNGAADATWMQLVAREMNLSETAFLSPRSDGWDLRWFTPTVEVDLCGHATLASAYVLFHRQPGVETLRFHSRSGWLFATQRDDWIELDFPSKPAVSCAPPTGLLAALGVHKAAFVGKSQFDYLVELFDHQSLTSLRPDHVALATLPVRGIIVTTASPEPQYDFWSRFFAPGAGVPEDPVTGSAHCCLAPYWMKKLGRNQMTGYQASARGGVVRVTCNGDRVILAGQAVAVLEGTLL